MTNEMVTTVMDFAETVKMVEEMKKNAEANVAFANQLKANIVTLQESVQQDVASYSNKTCHHLTANQKRARAIEMAKEFVEDQKSTLSGFVINGDGGFKTYENVYSPVNRKTGIKAACNAEFVRKGNRVTCLLKGVESNQVYCVGRSECRVDDVFNERIGEAIALAKALDIVEQLPPDILKAVQPDSFVKGMKIVWKDYEGCINEREVEQLKGTRVYFTNESWMPNDEVSIIDDTNADYSLQGGEK